MNTEYNKSDNDSIPWLCPFDAFFRLASPHLACASASVAVSPQFSGPWLRDLFAYPFGATRQGVIERMSNGTHVVLTHQLILFLVLCRALAFNLLSRRILWVKGKISAPDVHARLYTSIPDERQCYWARRR